MSAAELADKRDYIKRLLPGVLLLAVLSAEFYFLLRDIPILSLHFKPVHNTGADLEKSIAELVVHRNDVRVQDPGNIIWNDAVRGQRLLRRQSLMTLENSSAEIAFLDGAGIVLGENTLIQMERASNDSSGRTLLTLLRGKIRKKPAAKRSDIEIRAGNATALAPSSSEITVSFSPEASGQARVTVHSGQTMVTNPGGSVVAKSGESVDITASPSQAPPVPEKELFELMAPVDGETIRSPQAAADVEFRLKSDTARTGENAIEISASTDSGFSTDVRKTIVGASHPPLDNIKTSIRLPATPGAVTWYWRVRNLGTGQSSAVARFSVKQYERPAPVLPAQGFRGEPGANFRFVWKSVNEAVSYDLRIIKSKNGKTAHEETVTAPAASVALRDNGDFSWHVRASLPGGIKTAWSTTFDLVLKEKSAPPPPPDLMDVEFEKKPVEPRPVHSILDFFLSSANAAGKTQLYNITLKWSAAPGAARYKIQIGRQSGFANIITETVTDAPAFKWQYRVGMENSKGRVFFRVASMDADGNAGRYSKPKAIQIPEYILNPEIKKEIYSATDGTAAPPAADMFEPVEEPAPAKPVPPPAVVAAPQPAPAPAPAPVSKTEAVAETGSRRWLWNIRGAAHAGIGTHKQSSEPGSLQSVSPVSMHLLNRFSAQASVRSALDRRTGTGYGRKYTMNADVTLAKYKKPPSSLLVFQKDATAFKIRFVFSGHESLGTSWDFSFGGSFLRSFRWGKASAMGVEPDGAYSIGPFASASKHWTPRWPFLPENAGFALRLPLSGLITNGMYGAEVYMWTDWKLLDIYEQSVGATIQSECSYSRWASPPGTAVFEWSSWAGFFVRLNGTMHDIVK